MAGGRAKHCTGCGRLLAVPSDARAVGCALCGTVMSIKPYVNSKRKRSWLKEIVAQLASNFSQQGSVPQELGSPSLPRPMSYHGGRSNTQVPDYYRQPRGSKRALLIGVSYKRKPYELKGTVNDVACMRYMLMKHGFEYSCIIVMTEEQGHPTLVPTKTNMLAAMRWLVKDCKPGDSLVFHFSGHGSQQLDLGGEERDGFDETLCPTDYEANGMIVDNLINDIMVRPLVSGVKLHAVIDSCHSGTALDLPFLCRMGRTGFYQWEDHRVSANKGTSGGLAISFSGCDDDQTSVDTNALSNDFTTTGAMTYSFIQAIENEPRPTYGRLLTAMRSKIRNVNVGLDINGPIAPLFRRIFPSRLKQVPQLCSSEVFDVYEKQFVI